MRALLLVALLAGAGVSAESEPNTDDFIAMNCMAHHIVYNDVNRSMLGKWTVEPLDSTTTYGESYAVVIQYGSLSKYLSCIVSKSGTVFAETNEYSDRLQQSLN